MNIELTVVERLALLSMLPATGSLMTLRLVRELREALSFDEAELASLQFETGDNQVTWNPEAEVLKTVSLGATAMQLIQNGLSDLDEKGELRMEHLSLCDKLGIGE